MKCQLQDTLYYKWVPLYRAAHYKESQQTTKTWSLYKMLLNKQLSTNLKLTKPTWKICLLLSKVSYYYIRVPLLVGTHRLFKPKCKSCKSALWGCLIKPQMKESAQMHCCYAHNNRRFEVTWHAVWHVNMFDSHKSKERITILSGGGRHNGD